MPTNLSDSFWSVRAVAVVSSPRVDVTDDGWDDVLATVTLLEPFDSRSLQGIEAFSHLDVVFLFDRVDPEAVCTTSRIPRGNPEWPDVGIFAQRAKDRPNRIGVSTCALVEVGDGALVVRGLDAVDATPVLDIKPYMEEFGPRGPLHQPPWSRELMAGYY